MRITISGRNIDLTDGLKGAVEEKLSKLEKYFTPDTDVYVTLSVEKERQKIEVTIPMKGNIIRSEQVSNDSAISKKRTRGSRRKEQIASLGFMSSAPWRVCACLHHHSQKA